METHLPSHDWFAGGRYSIADIALYGYTHCAGEGGFDLAAWPAVSRWRPRGGATGAHPAVGTLVNSNLAKLSPVAYMGRS